MTVSVHIVTWNSRPFLPTLLDSLRHQTYPIDRVFLVDNASTDGTLAFLEGELGLHVLRNTRNLGFARAHNQAIRLTHSDAVLVTNPDLLLEPTCLAELVRALEANPRLGSVCPKLRRFSFTVDDLREPIRSDTIDAAGLTVRRSRQVVNRGEGESDRGQCDAALGVFGAPGVLALYRRSALDDVTIDGQIFDEDYFAYKEDVDLSWRLQSAGWGCGYVPTALAYHHRTLTHHGDRLDALVAERRRRSPRLRILSYRNHLLTLVKNEQPGTFLPHLPMILAYEVGKLGYLAVREPGTLAGLGQAIRLLPNALRKRRAFAQRHRTPSSTLRRQFQ